VIQTYCPRRQACWIVNDAAPRSALATAVLGAYGGDAEAPQAARSIGGWVTACGVAKLSQDDTWVPLVARASGTVGGVAFEAGGALMGSMNAGWFDLQRDANRLFPLLGLGVALVVFAWAVAGWPAKLWGAGAAGRPAVILLSVAPVVYLLSWAIEFAIFGTLTLGLGLVLLTVAMWRRRLSDRVDRVLVTLAAVGSLTWNTETLSDFLLV
jgi:hypothetical protein